MVDYDFVKVELVCGGNPERVHHLAVPVEGLRNGVPMELIAHPSPSSPANKSTSEECCLFPNTSELEGLVLREVAFGGVEEARRYGWVRIDPYQRVS